MQTLLDAIASSMSNLLDIADARDRLGGTRDEQDRTIWQAISSGQVCPASYEGRITDRQQKAVLPLPGEFRGAGYLSRWQKS